MGGLRNDITRNAKAFAIAARFRFVALGTVSKDSLDRNCIDIESRVRLNRLRLHNCVTAIRDARWIEGQTETMG